MVRLFGGWDLGSGLCDDPNMIGEADRSGVPMGSSLPARRSGSPTFLVSALRDPGTQARRGTPLQRLQVIKGWIEAGEAHQRVFDVAGNAGDGASVDESCVQRGPGFDSLCAEWTDPDFNPSQHAFYYARVLENPSCRWSAYDCNSLPPAEQPVSCADPEVPRVLQERAWTSPIWYEPQR